MTQKPTSIIIMLVCKDCQQHRDLVEMQTEKGLEFVSLQKWLRHELGMTAADARYKAKELSVKYPSSGPARK